MNPDHLEIGTNRDNQRDAIHAGTQKGVVLDRYQLGTAYRLSLFGFTQEFIAKQFGCTQGAVSTMLKKRGLDSSHRSHRLSEADLEKGRRKGGGKRKFAAKVNASLTLPGIAPVEGKPRRERSKKAAKPKSRKALLSQGSLF